MTPQPSPRHGRAARADRRPLLSSRHCALALACTLLVAAACSSSHHLPGGSEPDSPTVTWRGSRDAATDAAMAQLAASHEELCHDIARLLAVDPATIHPHTRVIVRKRLRAAGMALGHRIWIHDSITGSEDAEELRGLYIHELAHTFQTGYPLLRKPLWLVEGIADYVRHELARDSDWAQRVRRNFARAAARPIPRVHYTDGYFPAAALLLYIEANYDPEFVRHVHRALESGTYRKAIFKERTGKGLDTLWREMLRQAKHAPAPAVT